MIVITTIDMCEGVDKGQITKVQAKSMDEVKQILTNRPRGRWGALDPGYIRLEGRKGQWFISDFYVWGIRPCERPVWAEKVGL